MIGTFRSHTTTKSRSTLSAHKMQKVFPATKMQTNNSTLPSQTRMTATDYLLELYALQQNLASVGHMVTDEMLSQAKNGTLLHKRAALVGNTATAGSDI